jgi:hypothetical protein
MRSAPWLCLSVVCLVAGLGAAPVQARSPRAEAAGRPVLRQEFVGYGTTARDAEQHALEQARDWLAEKGDLDWTPPPDYLRQKGMVRFSEPTEEDLKRTQNLPITRRAAEEAGMKVIKMGLLTVTAGQKEEMQQVAREHRMKERQGLVARVLAGLVALLLVAGGYLRLEEATRGYYTTLLRGAALVVLALVGALLCVVA